MIMKNEGLKGKKQLLHLRMQFCWGNFNFYYVPMLRSKSGQLFTQKTYHVKYVCTYAVVSMFLRKTRVAKTSTLFIAFKSPTSISAMGVPLKILDLVHIVRFPSRYF